MEELVRIKDELSSSCEGDIRKIVQTMNTIVKGERLTGKDVVQQKKRVA